MQADKLDHRLFLSSLSDEERQALNATSNSKSFAHLIVHLLMLATTGGIIALKLPYWWLLLIPHGILLIFLFTLQHETIHRTVFTDRRANDAIAAFVGFLLLNPAIWFRYFHLAHHRHTNDPKNDPELQGTKPETRRQYLVHLSGAPLWWSAIKTIVVNAFFARYETYIPSKARPRVVWEARVHLTFYAMILVVGVTFEMTNLLWLWIVPALFGQPFLRLYLMAEHGHCPPVANMFENSRTTFTNLFVRRIAWNMPYHSEHHAIPTVPFHNLPRLNKLAKSHLKSTSSSYHDFHRDSLRKLRRT